MQKFESGGKSYSLTISFIPQVETIYQELGLDILIPQDLEKLTNSPRLTVSAIYAIVSTQCDEYGVSAEQFGSTLNFKAAVDAFIAELTAFFRQTGQGAIAELVEATVAGRRKLDESMAAKMKGHNVTAAIEAKAEQAAARFDDLLTEMLSGKPSGGGQESQA